MCLFVSLCKKIQIKFLCLSENNMVTSLVTWFRPCDPHVLSQFELRCPFKIKAADSKRRSVEPSCDLLIGDLTVQSHKKF